MQLHLPPPVDASEQALEEVFRHTPVGVVMTDLHGTILDANRAFCSMLGRARTEVVQSRLFHFVHPEDAAVAEAGIASLRREERSSVETVRRWLASDGRVITTWVTASVVRSGTGEPTCGIAFVEDIGERLAMEKALRESEARYRRVVEDQTELIVRCMPDGTRTFVNDAYCRYAGLPAAELIGQSFFPFIPEDEWEAIHRKYASLTPEDPVATEEHHAYAADGSLRWHRWTDRGIFDASGALVEIQAVGRDITDERDAQDRLRRSEESYRRLYGALPVAVWETRLQHVIGQLRLRGLDTPERLVAASENRPELACELASLAEIVTANDAAMAMTGASSPAGIVPWLAAHHTEEAMLAYVRGVAPLLLGEVSAVDLELPLLAPDGTRLDLLQRLARQPDWSEDPKLIVMTLDVTERKRAERDLAHRRQILEEAEVLARIGSWEWDPVTGRVFGSAGFWRIFSGEPTARFGTPEECLRCFREDFHPVVRQSVRVLRTLGRTTEESCADMVLVHADGTELIARGASFAERSGEGRIVRIFGVVQDVTEQRRIEEAAKREHEVATHADKMISLGVLVSGVAHEVNNPNHSIMLNASLLRDAWRSIVPVLDRAALQEDVRVANVPWEEMRGEVGAMIEDIEQAAERIRGIVTELRGFALGHDSGERRSVSLNSVVHSALRLLGNHIRKATSRLSVRLADELPGVLANHRRIEQVLVNLLINACQALEKPDRAITIETGCSPTHVFVRVADEGRGITREDLRKIKDPFFTTKRAAGGSGLGLAVSDRIVQEHGGELLFESEPGRGTIATLTIPAFAS